jgi:hypothetical protein
MSLPIRYSPSGAVIATMDAGARLRLTEATIVMGGSLAIPAVADVIGPDGFGDADALVLTFDKPKQLSMYRAELELDVINASTNVGAEVVLYLDTSVDGGTTWTNRAKTMHKVGATTPAGQVRPIKINLDITEGSNLGVFDSVPPDYLKLRARASLPVGVAASVTVDSLATSGGGTPVAGCTGTVHMELEECLGS